MKTIALEFLQGPVTRQLSYKTEHLTITKYDGFYTINIKKMFQGKLQDLSIKSYTKLKDAKQGANNLESIMGGILGLDMINIQEYKYDIKTVLGGL